MNKGEFIHIDYSNILKYLKVRPPYIFVDQADVVVGESAESIRTFTFNEWFFECHLPDDPIVPGVFILEFLIQTGALAIHPQVSSEQGRIYAKNANFNVLNAVHPGETLHSRVKIKSFKRGIVQANGEAFLFRNNQEIKVCTADFNMILPQMLASISPVKRDE